MNAQHKRNLLAICLAVGMLQLAYVVLDHATHTSGLVWQLEILGTDDYPSIAYSLLHTRIVPQLARLWFVVSIPAGLASLLVYRTVVRGGQFGLRAMLGWLGVGLMAVAQATYDDRANSADQPARAALFVAYLIALTGLLLFRLLRD